MLLSRGAAVALVLIAACGGDDGPAPVSCPIGDRSQPIELVPVAWAGTLDPPVDLADGAVVPLRRPLQGGKVIFVGVRARNVDGCAARLTGALRDAQNGEVVALEARPTRLVARADGWGVPEEPFLASLANVAACPNADADRDLDGNPWRLELRLDEDGGRSATVTVTIVPRCLQLDEQDECACECDSDFVIGGACPVDPVDAGV